jgi:hypothetical protein
MVTPYPGFHPGLLTFRPSGPVFPQRAILCKSRLIHSHRPGSCPHEPECKPFRKNNYQVCFNRFVRTRTGAEESSFCLSGTQFYLSAARKSREPHPRPFSNWRRVPQPQSFITGREEWFYFLHFSSFPTPDSNKL